ncbi:murein DD-endopeptidase MepM/ murein hydrolase activator NlpD [Deinobacterium chartae]|uniref:Murein DD-endopeptidase MepM/ murein hydrolase activator NlpD n=1 Tax=Deinobacterium chartae TaxID=521158 RepID=A0A841HTF2_9DEIO|nr:murein DD-endopeptidase MepM/ murein hydrolase activator NlpD [Deinobacterium chartae]
MFERPTSTSIKVKLQPQPQEARGFAYVRVEQGESLSSIARAYGTSVRRIQHANSLKAPNLKLGQILRVPIVVRAETHRRLPPGVFVHVVKEGDSLSSIRDRYGLTTIELISANPYLESLDRMEAGTELLIPSAVRGLIVRVKQGQDAVSLAEYYGSDVGRLAQVNGLESPTDLGENDLLLIPGVMAETTLGALHAKREHELERKRKLEQYARYQRYLAYLKDKQRRELQAKYERQAKYEQYLAWKERREQQAKYERQAKYEQYLAWLKDRKAEQAREEAIARQRAAEQARLAAQQRASSARAVVTRASSRSGGYGMPVPGARVTSGYGPRNFWIGGSNFHTGVDFAAPVGTPIYAASSGTVTASGWGGYGINVFVDVGNTRTIYGHMSRTAVHVGQNVERGDLLGYVGCTGICTGPHLHFEVQVNGRHVNPFNYLP